MGMEDRDWYREKKIDWERGGLKDRYGKKPRKWLRLLVPAVIVAVVWYILHLLH